jgi:hypothetical protein
MKKLPKKALELISLHRQRRRKKWFCKIVTRSLQGTSSNLRISGRSQLVSRKLRFPRSSSNLHRSCKGSSKLRRVIRPPESNGRASKLDSGMSADGKSRKFVSFSLLWHLLQKYYDHNMTIVMNDACTINVS